MSPERSVFPDKKIAEFSYKDAVKQIQETKRFKEKFSVGQEFATWMPYGEYPDLPITFTWMPDIHFGSTAVDYDTLDKHLQLIESSPNMFMLFGGDMIDNFNPSKYPDGMLQDAIDPQEQILSWMSRVIELDAKSKVAGVVWGNHENFLSVAGIDVFQTFLRDLQAPILNDGGGVITTIVGGATYRIGARHTHWGNSSLNITNAPKRMGQFGYPDLDVMLVGHVHKAGGEMLVQAGEEKIAVTGGTYKLDDSFAKKWGHSPALGGFTIMLWPNEKKMQLFRTVEEAHDTLQGKIALSLTDNWQDPYTKLIQELNAQHDKRK